jgi:taurine dioxygenase
MPANLATQSPAKLHTTLADFKQTALSEHHPGGTGSVAITPYSAAAGARISGLRYQGQPMAETTAVALREALFEHGFLEFEPGTVQAGDFVEFLRFLGQPVPYAGPHMPSVDGTPLANAVDSSHDKYLRNHIWHIDGAFRLHPPTLTALYGHQIPGVGGDTVFSNATLAYEQLPPLFAAYLNTLQAVSSAEATGHLMQRYSDSDELARQRAKLPPIIVPVIRQHPVTGRRQIFVNESYTAYIEGVSRVTSDHLLGILFNAIKSPDVQGRYVWREGALVVWDNRVVQHRGVKDYGDNRRILYRAAIA